jgi:hypothetical protein
MKREQHSVRRRPAKVFGALASVAAMVVASMFIPSYATAPAAPAPNDTPPPCDSGGPCTQTKTLQNWKQVGGQLMLDPRPGASVTVSQTESLQQRQNINISWSGFLPSMGVNQLIGSGVTPDPGNDPPLHQQNTLGQADTNIYPVVVTECWGIDNGEMDPSHCQGLPAQHPHTLVSSGSNGPAEYAMTQTARDVSTDNQGNMALGFTDVTGKHYNMFDDVPPNFLYDNREPLPSNMLTTFSDPQGSRQNVQFQVRGGDDQGGGDTPQLGCSVHIDCTLEIIPIVRPFCDTNPQDTGVNNPTLNSACTGADVPVTKRPGNRLATAINPFETADTWWLAPQWANRFAFPLKMAQVSGTCAITGDNRPTLQMQGSEPAKTVVANWGQQFCDDPKSAFKVTQTVTPEEAARSAVDGGSAAAGLTTLADTDSPRPVVHAPIAVTGWTVAFAIDRLDSTGTPEQLSNLTLSPLLLAKLMTDSYSEVFEQGGTSSDDPDPAVAKNPRDLFRDPEFQKLNPDFPTTLPPDNPSVTWLSQDSDTFAAVFAYVDADPVAHAFLQGQPDPFSGMMVNPAYRGKLAPPQQSFQQLDPYQDQPDPKSSAAADCVDAPPVPLYGRAIPLAMSLEVGAQDAQGGHPQYLTCDLPDGVTPGPGAGHWAPPSGTSLFGARMVLALTTVPMAEIYGLPMANLQSDSQPVAPSGWEGPDTIQKALGFTKQDPATGVTSPDFQNFPFNGAYPGMMPIYAAVPACGLDPTTAGQVADFLQFAATSGQQPGQLAGKLPPGYTPLPAAYTKVTQTDAQAIRTESPTCPGDAPPAPPSNLAAEVLGELGLPTSGTDVTLGFDDAAIAAVNGAGGGGAPTKAAGKPAGAAKTNLATTKGVYSWLAQWGIPMLLGLGLLTGLSRRALRVFGRPGHPVRRFLARIRRDVRTFSGRVRSTLRAATS